MTRTEAINKVKEYLRKVDGCDVLEAEAAFAERSPMRGCLLMLEALGLIKFEDGEC